jgi:hypothetical protein
MLVERRGDKAVFQADEWVFQATVEGGEVREIRVMSRGAVSEPISGEYADWLRKRMQKRLKSRPAC